MQEHIGKTIKDVITTDRDEELLIFTDGTNTLIGAEMGQGIGYAIWDNDVNTDKYIRCSKCGLYIYQCDCGV